MGRLPLAFQDADAASGQPLQRWLGLLWDQVGPAVDMIDEFTGTVSRLMDPATADDAWLSWLGQFVGLQLPASMPAPAKRAAILAAASSLEICSVPYIVAVAKRYLKPGATVRVMTDVADMWHYTVQVYQHQVLELTLDELDLGYPLLSDVLTAFPRLSDLTVEYDSLLSALTLERPAGMVMTLELTGGTLDDLGAAYSPISVIDSTFSTMDDIAVWEP
jgi:hypothetical protein